MNIEEVKTAFILNIKGSFILEYLDTNRLMHLLLHKGKEVNQSIEPLSFRIRTNLSVEKLIEKDFVFGDMVDVVSAKVKQIIEEYYPTEVQFIKTNIFDNNNNCIDSFYVMNILNKIECLNMEKSVYNFHWDKVVPLSLMLGKLNIVRSSESDNIIVSDNFREIFKKNRIKNIEFLQEKTY